VEGSTPWSAPRMIAAFRYPWYQVFRYQWLRAHSLLAHRCIFR
jgi:hypothetical protein